MAHSLKLTAVAEGVETEAQLEFLRAQRCDEMQGYLFSAPVPASEFEELLDASKSLAARRNRVTR
jgi:EAL domain-containing protein (putative c-di-GMP-specific phosphodiesterase class I)